MDCSFCSAAMPKGTGLMYVKKDGTPYYFCCGKCKKNALDLNREGRRQKWTISARRFKESIAKKKKE